ncbi:retrovirus-related pol polyprotein from transposon TNT 1-94 [Tanacetum coccineum]
MSSNSDDIQAAGSDTRPPMLDRTDYESWSQRIRLNTLGTTPEGGVLLGPIRPRTYDDLSDAEKKRYDADVRATNIVLQGLPKDIYKLINHNIEAKAIWDNVKMLLIGSELTKEDRESQLYDEFERFKMLLGENINEYYVRFHKLVNDMRNIKMTMPNIQLNSKFVNNMLPEWDRFITPVKLNKGLKETNHEQMYTYLKQHEKHAAQDQLIIERITPTANDQLAFVSTVQPHAPTLHVQSHQYPSSSATPQSPQFPHFPETSQPDSEHTQTDEILDNLTKQMALLAQSFKATLPQTNNQLRTSSNTRNQATIQDGWVVVQNVQRRQNQNQNQRYFARGNGAAGNGGVHNRAENANAGQGKPVGKILRRRRPAINGLLGVAGGGKCYNCNGLGHIAWNCTQSKRPRNFDYFKDNVLLMQAQENGAALNEEELLFLTREQANTFDADVDNQPVQDLALNEDNIFQADEYDAFDSDVDDEPAAQSIFMANLSSSGSANQQAAPSNASILSEANVIDSTSIDMGNSNVIPYEQYLSVDNIYVVPSSPERDKIYKVTSAIYEQRAKFELTEREQRMDDQMPEVDPKEIDLKSGEIEQKNLLITNENLIAECLSKDVFYTATDSVLNVSRFSDMHDAFTIAQKRIADLESEKFNLRNKIQNDDHDSMIKHYSKLEVEHFNLQLKYQNLKERFGNKKPVTSSDAPLFDSLFMIGKLNEQIQSLGNTICELKDKISRLTKKNSDVDPIFDLKALVSQNKDLTTKLNALHDLNERFRAENAKVKQHYKELYDSIKITRAQTTDQNNSLLSEIKNLKAQLKDNYKCVTKVLAPGRYPIDVEPIPPRLKKNQEVHLH